MSEQTRRCNDCACYEQGAGQCRAGAPVVNVIGDAVLKFPPMPPDGWCYAFIEREETETVNPITEPTL